MNTVFLINGGIGRVIAAIPALEKFHRLNPHDDFRVLVSGWESVFWSHPVLQNRTFGLSKGNFETHIMGHRARQPEPYLWPDFYHQKLGLVDAFDAEINHCDEHGDLRRSGYVYVSDIEQQQAREILNQLKRKHNRSAVIMMQPFGSTVHMINNRPMDRSNRSLDQEHYLKLAQRLGSQAVLLYASSPQFRHSQDNITVAFDEHQPWLRWFMAFMHECDYFVGVCSVGQHLARAMDVPGTIFMGATSDVNFGYAEHFDIVRRTDRVPRYSAWRLSDVDCEFSDRENDGIMDFSDQQLDEAADSILSRLKAKAPTTSNTDQPLHDSDVASGGVYD